MTPMLETLSWIAAIIAVPFAVVGWFVSGAQKASKAVAGKGGTAISGDMDVKTACIVAGRNSSVKVSLAVSNDTQNADRYERRYALFQAVGKTLNEALCDKMISAETFQPFFESHNRLVVLVCRRRIDRLPERAACAGCQVPSNYNLHGGTSTRRRALLLPLENNAYG